MVKTARVARARAVEKKETPFGVSLTPTRIQPTDRTFRTVSLFGFRPLIGFKNRVAMGTAELNYSLTSQNRSHHTSSFLLSVGREGEGCPSPCGD